MAQRIRLLAGQVMSVSLARGSVLRVERGDVVVTGELAWLADQPWWPHWRLRQGLTLQLERAGVYQLQARFAVELLCAVPPAARPGWWRCTAALWSRLGLQYGPARAARWVGAVIKSR
ncbi:MAG TPA: hypothetical protein VLC08_10250 [Chitinolyticbacter sp.]|nr:hypothetical protein [Chitinolyticbacter sp.]